MVHLQSLIFTYNEKRDFNLEAGNGGFPHMDELWYHCSSYGKDAVLLGEDGPLSH